MNYYTPKEIPNIAFNAAINKAQLCIKHLLILGVLGGIYIGFAAEGSTMAVHDITSVGISRFLSGVIFSTGLMLVVICGAELFTGNVLLFICFLENKLSLMSMLRNWFWVYLGNIVGSVVLAYMMDMSGLWMYNNFLHGGYALKIAVSKVNLTFVEAFVRGILCNFLVCLAIWMGYAAKDITGKVWGIFFPIMLFITSSFEHSVANMYYLMVGLLLKNNSLIVSASELSGKVNSLTVATAVTNNLLPVTLGNIIGGAIFVGSAYWYCYLKENHK